MATNRHAPNPDKSFALLKTRTGLRIAVRVLEENKRHVWVQSPSGEEWRETQRAASWRFPSRQSAQAMASKMETEVFKIIQKAL